MGRDAMRIGLLALAGSTMLARMFLATVLRYALTSGGHSS